MDLLRWWRFLWAVEIGWDQATSAEARDFCCWIGLADKPLRPHWRYSAGGAPGTRTAGAPGTPNLVTGKRSPGRAYAAATVVHCESVLPGQKMAGDITYIETWEGWAFLATVIDCATRKVIGWAIDDNYRTPLITAAIKMAARNLDLPPGAVFHSDRGSNYTSAEFGAVLAGLDIRQSVGRTGICYDNALADSFNAAVKVERVYRTVYLTRKKAAEDIARYIELRYNRTRLHSGLGYKTPQEVHDEYLNRQLAA
jgi:transposase InsO family protein